MFSQHLLPPDPKTNRRTETLDLKAPVSIFSNDETTTMDKEDPDDMSVQVTAFDDEPLADPATIEPFTPPPVPPVADTSFSHRVRGQMLRLPKEVRNLLAGGLAGMLAKSVVAPFDRIKILYQVSSAEFHIRKVPEIAWRIAHQEGVPALWKGNTATMIRVFPYSGIQFMVFDRCKTFLLREQELNYMKQKAVQPDTPKPKWGLTPLESLCAGMAAGAVSVIATYPLDLTRAQLAVLRTKKGEPSSSTKNIGFVDALLNNYRNGRGVNGLFRGIAPTLLGILPYSGLAFAFNEQAKRKVRERKKERDRRNVDIV